MEYTRTAQPAPSLGGTGTTFRNPTSNFAQQQEAKAAAAKAPEQPAKGQAAPDTPATSKLAAWRRDDNQAAERQQAADKGRATEQAGQAARFRRPGQAPDGNADRVRQEQRMVDQFKQQFKDQSQERGR